MVRNRLRTEVSLLYKDNEREKDSFVQRSERFSSSDFFSGGPTLLSCLGRVRRLIRQRGDFGERRHHRSSDSLTEKDFVCVCRTRYVHLLVLLKSFFPFSFPSTQNTR